MWKRSNIWEGQQQTKKGKYNSRQNEEKQKKKTPWPFVRK
jgi:hypothetical protein